MFTEYALNALLKQTYARARAGLHTLFALVRVAAPTLPPLSRLVARATGIYITNHGPRRKLFDLARNLSAPMEKVDRESPSANDARTAFAQRLASHGRLDRAIFLRALLPLSGFLTFFAVPVSPVRRSNREVPSTVARFLFLSSSFGRSRCRIAN